MPIEAVSLSVLRRGVALRTTRLPLSPHCNPFSARLRQPRCFPPQSNRFFSLFCRPGFRGQSRTPALARAGTPRRSPIHPPHARQATSAHSVTAGWPMHRTAGSQSVSYAGRKYHFGSTSTHKNRSPRKQGRTVHAIGKRPESASTKSALPPSTHPKLGVSSRHQRFHRCALQRIFRPSLGNGRSD